MLEVGVGHDSHGCLDRIQALRHGARKSLIVLPDQHPNAVVVSVLLSDQSGGPVRTIVVHYYD